MEALAKRYQGRSAFDPSTLAAEYGKACDLANFIGYNYAPLRAAVSSTTRGQTEASVLAVSALLLFIHDWDMNLAVSGFTRIAAAAGSSSQDLGNVMGLNPFHDYEAWRALKQAQELNLAVPYGNSVVTERELIKAELSSKFGVILGEVS